MMILNQYHEMFWNIYFVITVRDILEPFSMQSINTNLNVANMKPTQGIS
jgi:hypothetical protein